MLVLAVKPQSLDHVAPHIAALAGERTLLLSIIAGKTIADLLARLPQARAVVRAMPNTPAAIGRGVTAAFATPQVDADQRGWCERLLGAVGAFFWLDGEDAIDAVTAISGSGPAYVFALTEALAAAAERLGLSPDLSMKLARGTVEGAGELYAPRKPNLAGDVAPQRHPPRRHHCRRACGAPRRGRSRRSHDPRNGGGPRPRRRDGWVRACLVRERKHAMKAAARDATPFSFMIARTGAGRPLFAPRKISTVPPSLPTPSVLRPLVTAAAHWGGAS